MTSRINSFLIAVALTISTSTVDYPFEVSQYADLGIYTRYCDFRIDGSCCFYLKNSFLFYKSNGEDREVHSICMKIEAPRRGSSHGNFSEPYLTPCNQ